MKIYRYFQNFGMPWFLNSPEKKKLRMFHLLKVTDKYLYIEKTVKITITNRSFSFLFLSKNHYSLWVYKKAVFFIYLINTNILYLIITFTKITR